MPIPKHKLPDAMRLDTLRLLREERGISQTEAAKLCGLMGRQGRISLGAWERGASIPHTTRRLNVLHYLWDHLGLRNDLEQFEELWETFVEEWGWEPLGDQEWSRLTKRERPRKRQDEPQSEAVSGGMSIPKPQHPIAPPVVNDFVGRIDEQNDYCQSLTTHGLAVISGMAGIGKTALASVLALQEEAPERIFWHTFHAQEDSYVLFWKLAAFLAWHEQDSLWRMLNSAQLSGGQLPPPEILQDYLLQTLPDNSFLLCLDDLHFVQADPILNQFLTRLQPSLGSNGLRLLITTRSQPDFIQTEDDKALDGLSDVDTYHFVNQRGIHLNDDALNRLYIHTEGNPQFLTLAVNALRTVSDIDDFLKLLTKSDNIERYLMNAVDTHLSDDERLIMGAVATLQGYPGSRDLFEAILERDDIARIIYTLTTRNLLTSQIENESGKRSYGQHAIVQAFYYGLLGRRTRLAQHQRAGAYYDEVENDKLAAARHYHLAEAYSLSAQLAALDHGEELIGRGEIGPLRSLLERFSKDHLPDELWVAVNGTLGRIYWFTGESEQARNVLQNALEILERCTDSPLVNRLRTRTNRFMAVLEKSRVPDEALIWVYRGLEAIDPSEDADEAAQLHIIAGNINVGLGNFTAARESLDRGQTLLSSYPSHVQIDALMGLAKLYGAQGKIEPCRTHSMRALALSEELHDYHCMTIILNQLAYTQQYVGEWHDAINSWHKALDLAFQMGNSQQQISVTLNLGVTYKDMGEDEQALGHLKRALGRAKEDGQFREFALYCHCSLADLYLRQEDINAALSEITEAEQLVEEMGYGMLRPYVQQFWSRAYLAQQQLESALVYAENACTLADQQNAATTQGTCRRVYGQVLAALNRPHSALRQYEVAIHHLAENPYDLARTHLEQAKTMIALGENIEGELLLGKSMEVFAQLGAKRELVESTKVKEVLSNKLPVI
ncbi:MAG: tetratricopeptide repeat protein [Chloroflexota bacterium]